MNSIVGMSELMLDTPLNSEQQEYAKTISFSAAALLTIINDILDFSKIEAGQFTFEAAPFDLRASVEDIVRLLATQAAERGIELAALYHPDAPTHFVADSGRVRQALVNLVGNAVKFTKKGHVLLEVTCLDRGAERAEMRIDVVDTGIGMSEEAQKTIFDKFTQADSSITRRFGGTGLGLAITKRIVEAMGGGIEVESVEGKGTRFSITCSLPLAPEQPAPEPSAGRKVRALVVSREKVIRRVLHEYLRFWGVDCDFASTAKMALGRLRGAASASAPLSVVFIDYTLGKTQGLDLAHDIRKEKALPRTALIMLTAMNTMVEAHHGDRLDLAGWIKKPCRFEAVRDVLKAAQAFLEGRTLESAPARGPSEGPEVEAGTDLRSVRVLVVEDNRQNQLVARRMLGKLGSEPDIVDNGKEAVAVLKDEAYDLVFMDCQMPVMDGFKATRLIRRMKNENRDIPIVAMTANAMQGDREKCLQAGMNDYVAKPITLKGMSANTGAEAVRELALTIENGAKEKNRDVCRQGFRELEGALVTLKQTLRQAEWSEMAP